MHDIHCIAKFMFDFSGKKNTDIAVFCSMFYFNCIVFRPFYYAFPLGRYIVFLVTN